MNSETLAMLEFWRVAKTVAKVGREMGFNGDATANDARVGSFAQTSDRLTLYHEIPANVKRLDPDLTWQLCGQMVMNTEPRQ